jgi:hypothetical protein
MVLGIKVMVFWDMMSYNSVMVFIYLWFVNDTIGNSDYIL